MSWGGIKRRSLDANHVPLVRGAEAAGITVVDMSALGGGVPDVLLGGVVLWHPCLLCGQPFIVESPCCNRQGLRVNDLVELKDGAKVPSARRLRESQKSMMAAWRGAGPRVATNAAELLAPYGISEQRAYALVAFASSRVKR